LVIYYAYDYFLTTDVVNTIHTGQLILQLFLVTIIPLLLSLLFQHIKPKIAHQAQQLSDYYMMVYYITVIVGGIIVLIQDFALFSGNI
jgi:predicted Na+-dependent transporter